MNAGHEKCVGRLVVVARCLTPVPVNVLHNILSHSAQEYSNDLIFATFTEY
jgi:hypothetical protein